MSVPLTFAPFLMLKIRQCHMKNHTSEQQRQREKSGELDTIVFLLWQHNPVEVQWLDTEIFFSYSCKTLPFFASS